MKSSADSSGPTFSPWSTSSFSPTPRLRRHRAPRHNLFEHKDLQTAYGHYYLQISNQAMDPLGECRSNVDLFRALAGRMGFDDECFAKPWIP